MLEASTGWIGRSPRLFLFFREDAEHYFFKCHKYLHERRKLFRSTHRYHPLNLDTVLRGRDALSFEDNVAIFNSVHEYIRDTNRF